MKIPFTTDLFLEASLKAIMDPRLARCGFDATAVDAIPKLLKQSTSRHSSSFNPIHT
jgi:hypothetical protein